MYYCKRRRSFTLCITSSDDEVQLVCSFVENFRLCFLLLESHPRRGVAVFRSPPTVVAATLSSITTACGSADSLYLPYHRVRLHYHHAHPCQNGFVLGPSPSCPPPHKWYALFAGSSEENREGGLKGQCTSWKASEMLYEASKVMNLLENFVSRSYMTLMAASQRVREDMRTVRGYWRATK